MILLQYGALRRKIGGTYKDFFKSYVDGTLNTKWFLLFADQYRNAELVWFCVVDGQYVEEGWVDKTCKVCKKDTRGEPRQVDKLGRYVHVACLEKPNTGNFFSRLFSGWLALSLRLLSVPIRIHSIHSTDVTKVNYFCIHWCPLWLAFFPMCHSNYTVIEWQCEDTAQARCVVVTTHLEQ